MAERAHLAALMACLNAQPPADINWDEVIALTNRTLTTGTLAEALHDRPQNLPQDVTAFLATVRARAAERNARLREQMREAVLLLNGAGIEPIPFKGSAMLCAPWRALAAGRMLSDLDLMVPQSAMARAEQCLAAAGYLRQAPTTLPNPVVLWRECDVGAIDLHCRIKAREMPYSHEALLALCTRHELDGGVVQLPSPTLQAAMLISHDQLEDRDYWRGHVDLRHLIDLSLLVRTKEGVDWEQLASVFPKGYARSALRTQLATLAATAHVAVPQNLSSGIWPQLQYRRRALQTRWPIMTLPATLFTLMLDPPVLRGSDAGEAGARPNGRRGFGTRLEALQRRFLRARAIGKV